MNYWFLYNVADGTIYGSPYLGNADIWTNIPIGTSVLGPISSIGADPSVQDAFLNPQYYTIEDGVLTPIAAYAVQQLADAKVSKAGMIQQAYENVLNAGFTSSATGALYHFAYNQLNQLKFVKLAIDVASGNVTFPLPIPSIDGTIVMHSQAQYTQLTKDISSFEWVLQNQLHGIIGPNGSITAATTVDQVNAITW